MVRAVTPGAKGKWGDAEALSRGPVRTDSHGGIAQREILFGSIQNRAKYSAYHRLRPKGRKGCATPLVRDKKDFNREREQQTKALSLKKGGKILPLVLVKRKRHRCAVHEANEGRGLRWLSGHECHKQMAGDFRKLKGQRGDGERRGCNPNHLGPTEDFK